MPKVLVTGGAGYIGSHTVVELVQAGYDVVVADNFSNSKPESLRRVAQIVGKDILCEAIDLCKSLPLDILFQKYSFDSIIHFAGLKAVGESAGNPLLYYSNNLISTINLCQSAKKYNVKNIVFSSSATVYGDITKSPIAEDSPIQAANPYGRTKAMAEDIFRDLASSEDSFRIALLRYFNPIGAHKSGLIGEDPTGVPNNLLPYVTQVASGRRSELKIFGNDYPTTDGTGLRDYIHVVDLARGHLAALDHIYQIKGCDEFNLGTGNPYSVLEIVKTFERISGKKIKYTIVERRKGDVATCFANPTKAKKILKWSAVKTLDQACADSWKWQTKNPNGFTI